MKPLQRVIVWVVVLVAIISLALTAYLFLKNKENAISNSTTDEAETMVFEVYFSRENTSDCSLVEPVQRTAPETADIARVAIEALLEGPTAQEMQEGYITSINPDVTLRDLQMSDSALIATFSSRLQEGAGSCRVTAIRAQIEQTLKQFATVSDVIIRIEGVPEGEELQP